VILLLQIRMGAGSNKFTYVPGYGLIKICAELRRRKKPEELRFRYVKVHGGRRIRRGLKPFSLDIVVRAVRFYDIWLRDIAPRIVHGRVYVFSHGANSFLPSSQKGGRKPSRLDAGKCGEIGTAMDQRQRAEYRFYSCIAAGCAISFARV